MFLDDMEFGFESGPIRPSHINRKGFIGSLISAGAGLLGGLIGDDEPDAPDRSVQPSTVSDQQAKDTNFVFSLEAAEAMDAFVGQLNDWAGQDREFFENTFQPFQASLIEANQELIPGIVANSGEALKSSLKDLMGGDFLKDAFRNQIGDSAADVSKFAESFSKQIDEIPSAEQRMGEAVAGVEQRFGEAGAELKRQMGARGLDVSEASKRNLAIEKAKAKAGAVGVAAEAARKERLAGAEMGVGVASKVQESQAGLLATQQKLGQDAANLAPQIGGVQDVNAISDATKVGADLTQSAAEKMLGTSQDSKGATFTQTGVVAPKFFDKETGALVDAAGVPIPQPVAPVATADGEDVPKTNDQRDSSSNGGGVASGQGFGGGMGAIGGVSHDRQPDRSGSGGQGGFQQ